MPSASKRGASPDAETDADYLAKRMKRHVTDAVELSDAITPTVERSSATGGHTSSQALPYSISTIETVDGNDQEPGRLFLRNLPYTVTQDTIREVFSNYGEVTEVSVTVRRTGVELAH